MQAIANWLEKLGMSEYAQRFAENRIDVSVLPELTDLDLEKIGVVLGDRRKILRAIRELGGTAPSAQEPILASPKPQDTAERRQVTVMFSDLASWLDRALCAPGPRGPARGHFRLSEAYRPNCPALRWVRSKIHGRWRAGLLRLSARP